MGFLRKLFGGGEAGSSGIGDVPGDDAEWRVAADATFDATADRQRVTIWLRLLDPRFESTREQMRVFTLENEVIRALEDSGVGEHDTNALERGFMAMRLVGDDADAIAGIVLPLLDDVPEGSYLAIRRGPASAGEDRVEVGAGSGSPA